MRKPIVGIMGPGRGATHADIAVAYELGQCIAQQGWLLLTGGRNEGVMHAASQGAKDAGGLIIGILPGSDPVGISSAVDIPILTGMGNARNNINVLSSDIVMVCGMGCGTASEVALALKVQKPVILLNASDVSQAFFQQLTDSPVLVAIDPAQAMAIAHNLFNSTAQLLPSPKFSLER
ncbi:TIGR00725 family protein [Egbenema bharatensis]|uniref:TIGR00725 family protein n=1 Tax=Egbenema bharatensis TaxID=3463334 RepID=UPI003A85E728